MKEFIVETRRWVEGYQYEKLYIDAKTSEEAERLVKDGQGDCFEDYVDVKNNDQLEVTNIEER